ncbi:MAG TPA: hypothetical protein VHK90_03850 [Thermoanaerobaculia bacterium]|nr:hypothetical protein [Thermoanaerobaculia bacterium]
MKRLAFLIVIVAVALGVCVVAVDALGDRDTFVPPPDAIAEQFTREVLTKRWPRAKDFLLEPESVSEDELRALHAALPDGTEVEAEELAREDDRALVNVRVSAPDRSEAVAFTLVFEEGWKIVM